MLGRTIAAMPYVELAGVNTYYEVNGEGSPVVLLHGGLAGAECWFGQAGPLSAVPFTVYTPERRGHGHTPDVEGPLTYEVMAADTVAFLETVVAGPSHIIGWSDGAVVGALVAMRRPDLVQRLILIGQYFNASGRVPGGLVDRLMGMRDAPPAFLAEVYGQTSPDGPDHFPLFFGKVLDMIASEPDLGLSDFAAIRAQTLVLQGDRDEVRVDHSAAVIEALHDGHLAVLPGSHLLPVESPEIVNALLISFLLDGPPKPIPFL